MKSLSGFLEISTIHGLYHIASNKGFQKMFWVFVVTIGFSGSSVMIYQAWDSWVKSPVVTTIETLPISELEFPNVTVCPPVKSFTDLNLDIVRITNISLSEGQRKNLSAHLSEVIFTSNMEKKWTAFTGYEENDRYRNQYQGLSMIRFPTIVGNGGLQGLRYIGRIEIYPYSTKMKYFQIFYDCQIFQCILSVYICNLHWINLF